MVIQINHTTVTFHAKCDQMLLDEQRGILQSTHRLEHKVHQTHADVKHMFNRTS